MPKIKLPNAENLYIQRPTDFTCLLIHVLCKQYRRLQDQKQPIWVKGPELINTTDFEVPPSIV